MYVFSILSEIVVVPMQERLASISLVNIACKCIMDTSACIYMFIPVAGYFAVGHFAVKKMLSHWTRIEKNNSDQALSCPRDWLIMGGRIEAPLSMKSFRPSQHGTIVPRGFRGASIGPPSKPQETPVSRTAGVICSRLGVQMAP